MNLFKKIITKIPIYQIIYTYKCEKWLTKNKFAEVLAIWSYLDKKSKQNIWEISLKLLNGAIQNRSNGINSYQEDPEFLKTIFHLIPDIKLNESIQIKFNYANNSSASLKLPNIYFLVQQIPELNSSKFSILFPIYQKIMYQAINQYERLQISKTLIFLQWCFDTSGKSYIGSNGQIYNDIKNWYMDLEDTVVSLEQKDKILKKLDISKLKNEPFKML